jgi:multidrug/hemolysin transport system permease protein
VVLLFLGTVSGVVMALLDVPLPNWSGILAYLAALVLSLAAFCSLHLLIATYLPSEGAVGGVSAIFSSVIGFLAGVYVPAGVLGQGMTTAVFTLPFGQSGLLIRDALAAPAFNALEAPEKALTALRNVYGFELSIGGVARPQWIAWAGVALLFVVCSAWCLSRVRRLKVRA